ncbi:MAG TPA: 23S rRNA (adenine(2503)-C(2))-methyltransferase RlmN [Polyangiaceae bacterium]
MLPVIATPTTAASESRSRRAPARESLFAALPAELAARGVRNPAHAFALLQRPWLWQNGRPAFGRKDRALQALALEAPRIVSESRAADGSTKLLFEVEHGDRIEAVHMPRDVGTGRVTLCISSQVGCAMGCTFCATATMGFKRQLGAHEIVGQVLGAVHALGPRHPGELTLVFMGMGEPLHNLPEVSRAIRVLCDPLGLGLSAKRITVSTSGLVPEIDALGALEPRPLLAVSVNATTDEQRARIMPVNRRYPLAELRAALERFPLRARERITIEYVLLRGVNDSGEDARRLSDFCLGFAHQINLIPFNEHRASEFGEPSEATVDAFARALLAHRPSVLTVRRSRGRDVGAACGQLVLER